MYIYRDHLVGQHWCTMSLCLYTGIIYIVGQLASAVVACQPVVKGETKALSQSHSRTKWIVGKKENLWTRLTPFFWARFDKYSKLGEKKILRRFIILEIGKFQKYLKDSSNNINEAWSKGPHLNLSEKIGKKYKQSEKSQRIGSFAH